MQSVKRFRLSRALASTAGACLVVAACVADAPIDLPTGDGETGLPGDEGAAGGEDNTFDHPDDGVDPWDILDRLSVEPDAYAIPDVLDYARREATIKRRGGARRTTPRRTRR